MDPLLKTVLIRTLGFLLFALVSPWLFVQVEYTEKNDSEEKYQLLRSLYESVASKYNMSIEEFNNFTNVAYEALSEAKPQWTYFSAADFVFQAITTIGYGTITPQTSAGQILCIFVSLIGIPITLLTLKSVGELVVKWVNTVVTKFERRILKRLQPKQVQQKSAVILFLFMLVHIIVNAGMLVRYYGWTVVEGVYFWFVSYSTIGFGDFTPIRYVPKSNKQLFLNNTKHYINKDESYDTGKSPVKLLKSMFFVFELFAILGLCVVSSVINSIVAALEKRKCKSQCFGCVLRKPQDPVDNQNDIPEQPNGEITYLGMENVGFEKENASSLCRVEIK